MIRCSTVVDISNRWVRTYRISSNTTLPQRKSGTFNVFDISSSGVSADLGGHIMRANFPLIWTLGLFFVSGLALARQSDNANSGSWSGVIINSTCSLDEAFAEAAKWTEKGDPGAKLSLYDDTPRQIFILDPQDQAVGHLGDSVTVSGTIEGNTLHIASFKMLTDIGLAVGRKAPAFTARDQFGREQSLDTLKGPKGTVLLFFRSADW